MKVARRVVIGAGVLVVVLVVASWVLLRTGAGLDFAWRFVEPRLPATLTVGDVSGRLVGPLELSDVRSQAEASTTSAASVRFDWRFWSLLARRVDMSDLLVTDVLHEIHADSATADTDVAEPLPDVDLPVEIFVTEGRVRRVTVVGVPNFTGVDSVLVQGLEARGEWALDSVLLWAPEGRVMASGSVTPVGLWQHDFTTRFDLTVDSLHVAGSVAAAGTLDSTTLDGRLDSPLSATAVGRVRNPRTRPEMELEIEADSVWLPALRADAPDVSVAGGLLATGVLDSIRFDGEGTVWAPDLPPATVSFDVVRRDSTITVDTTVVEIARTTLGVRGRIVVRSDAPDFDLTAEWSRFAWPLQGASTFLSDAGRARVAGSTTRYSVDLSGDAAPAGAPPGALTLRGRGSEGSMEIDTVTYRTAAGHVDARGRVGWGDVQTARLDFDATEVVTEELLPDSVPWTWRGALRGRANVSRTVRAITADLTVDTLSGHLTGTPLDRPLEGDVADTIGAPIEASGSGTLRLPVRADSLEWRAADVIVRWLEAEIGTGHAFVSGVVGDTVRLHATLRASDLSTVSARAEGRVEGKARLDGTRSAPALSITGEAERVRWDSLGVDSFVLDGTVVSSAGGEVDVIASAAGLSWGARGFDSLDIRAAGTIETHSLEARAVGDAGTLDVGVAGGAVDEEWEGTVRRLVVDSPAIGPWQLSGEAAAMLSRDAVSIDSLCVVDTGSSVCALGTWHRDSTTTARVYADGIGGARLAPVLPAGWSWDGTLSARSSVRVAADSVIRAEAEAELTAGQLTVSTRRGPAVLVTQPTTWTASIGEEGGRADIALQLRDEAGTDVIDFVTSVSLPTLQRVTDSVPALAVTGTLSASVLDFTPIESASPFVEDVTGELTLDATVAGTVGAPEFQGELDYRNGTFQVPDLGLDITGVRLRATGAGPDGVEIEGALTSGNEMILTGSVPQLPTVDNPARLHLEGTRLLALNSSLGTARVSPSIDVEVSSERVRVTGTVRVPTANIELSDVPETAVRPSPDVVFVDDSISGRRTIPLNVEARLELGDSVHVSGSGFSGRPTGSITVRDGTAQTLAGTGEITIEEGQFERYGAELNVVNGRMIYAGGPLDDPGLDIRATRTADDGVVAGVEIGGTLQQPVVTIFSEPAMLETEALSYLVLGRPIDQARQSDGNQLANVATSLGLREGNALATRIGQRFGLSELRVEADGPLEQASVVAGRYLSPKLYVSYGVGLVDPVSTFRLRYLLSSKWTLLAESGRSVGVDLMYRVERGRQP